MAAVSAPMYTLCLKIERDTIQHPNFGHHFTLILQKRGVWLGTSAIACCCLKVRLSRCLSKPYASGWKVFNIDTNPRKYDPLTRSTVELMQPLVYAVPH